MQVKLATSVVFMVYLISLSSLYNVINSSWRIVLLCTWSPSMVTFNNIGSQAARSLSSVTDRRCWTGVHAWTAHYGVILLLSFLEKSWMRDGQTFVCIGDVPPSTPHVTKKMTSPLQFPWIEFQSIRFKTSVPLLTTERAPAFRPQTDFDYSGSPPLWFIIISFRRKYQQKMKSQLVTLSSLCL